MRKYGFGGEEGGGSWDSEGGASVLGPHSHFLQFRVCQV